MAEPLVREQNILEIREGVFCQWLTFSFNPSMSSRSL